MPRRGWKGEAVPPPPTAGGTARVARHAWRGRRASSPVQSLLLDAGSRADGGADGGAQVRHLDELVLDHRGLHVRGVHPVRGQQRRRARWSRRSSGRWWCRSRGWRAASGRRAGRWRRRRRLGLEVDRLVDRAALEVLEDVLHALEGRVLAGRSGSSWPATPALLRAVITAPASPSLASIVALISGWAVKACWKIVPPLALSQPGASCSPTRVRRRRCSWHPPRPGRPSGPRPRRCSPWRSRSRSGRCPGRRQR